MVHPVKYPTTTSPLKGSSSQASPHKSPSFHADPILPWLRSIGEALQDFRKNLDSKDALSHYTNLLEDCITTFMDRSRYRDDIRLLKICVLYGDAIQDFKKVFDMMEEKGFGLTHALMYEAYMMFLVVRGDLLEAQRICLLGISRNAEPVDRLKKVMSLFLNHVSEIVEGSGVNKKADTCNSGENEQSCVNPWSPSTINNLLGKIDGQLVKCNGYYRSTKNYSGKVNLTSLKNSSRNKIIELGGRKYQVKGCSGQGGFAQIFKAYVDSNPDNVVALKIQRPAFPWEFYMYHQLDKHIPDEERSSFGSAHRVHIFSDWSILVCDYLSNGTLQDAINSYLVMQKTMEEVLCIYYTIEMLRMLETLHSAGIIHGDFKPDNLLVRYPRDDLNLDGFSSRTGPWHEQGLCLVDWGRGIDLSLFPAGTEFKGDSRTSGFRCVEMQENRTWTFQIDTYGLCVIVHMMLHGSYMSIEKKSAHAGSYHYQPKSSLKRYWNVDLWKNLFATLLNRRSNEDDTLVLQNLRKSFEEYMCRNPHQINTLKELLAKQRASLCSA